MNAQNTQQPFSQQPMPQGAPMGGMPGAPVPPQQQPPMGQQSQEQKKEKKPASFWVAIVLAIIAVIIAILFGLQQCTEQGGLRDPNGSLGQLAGKTNEEIQAELDRQVEEGMFNISIASAVEFADGTSEGELKIENVPGNRYLMQVTITDDATGQVVYTSGILDPNYHIQTAKLDVDLEPGTYNCTALFAALDPETEQEVGQAAAKIVINVLG